MRPLPRSVRVAALTVLAVLLFAAPASAVVGKKLRPLGPGEVVNPFKGGKAAKARPLASAAAVFGHGGFPGAAEPACCHVPELGGAVSPTQVVQVDAENLTVFDRYGARKKQTSIDGFCGGGTDEARVLYDALAKRWFVAVINGVGPNIICIAASQTASASGAYHVFTYGVATGGSDSRSLRMGMDADALFVTYDVHGGLGEYKSTNVLAHSKALMAGGIRQTTNLYTGLPSVTPPVVTDLERASSYFLATSADPSKLQLLEGKAMHRTGGTLTPKAQVAVEPETTPYASATVADQPGTTDGIVVGDARFQTSAYQVQNTLMAAHTIDRNGHPTVRWYLIDVDSATVWWAGRLAESSTSDDFAPSLAASSYKMFFTWTSTDARNPTVSRRHGPRMRYATWEIGEGSGTKSGLAARTGGVYRPAPGSDAPGWGRGQVTMAQGGYGSCPADTYAFAVGGFAPSTDRWQGYVKKFGTC